MRALYLECAAGISGDMAVAALLDLGADRRVLEEALASVPLGGFRTEIGRVSKNAIDCCDFNVILDEENHDHDMEWLFGRDHDHGYHHHDHGHGHDHADEPGHDHSHSHRGMAEITKIINETRNMTDSAKALAVRIFGIIAEAESEAHGVPESEVRFHEVGAVDSIVDVIAFAVCFDNLGFRRVFIPKIFEGRGTVRCQHGYLPIPVPAVLNIVKNHGLTLELSDETGEFVTPTGAAFAAAVRTDGELPATLKINGIGLGAGKRSYSRPSILRAMSVEVPDTGEESVILLESNIDNTTGENLGFLLEELMSAGARDAFYVPCVMKKSRPACILNVICTEDVRERMESLIFTHTATIGIRRSRLDRTVLKREVVEISTDFGPALVKVTEFGGKKRFTPEYESVAKISRETGIPFGEIYSGIIDSCKAKL